MCPHTHKHRAGSIITVFPLKAGASCQQVHSAWMWGRRPGQPLVQTQNKIKSRVTEAESPPQVQCSVYSLLARQLQQRREQRHRA